ncbi:MAG: chemotaxis-specific protein-glutamate methyltransferase CheB [Candidatus Cloacimonadota bacterium]|nr:chemotaxis-specific protein-glutamate methyltransferase CheB [Candidatus Cloacimonadota bacterium]
MINKLKIMVVDDTIIYRKILKDIIAQFSNCELVGTAPNGEITLTKIKTLKPDLILLDVEMPRMDGLQTLKEIKKENEEIGVIMVSGVNERQATITMEALSNGAIDFVPKPIGNNLKSNIQKLSTDLKPLIDIFYSKKEKHHRISPRRPIRKRVVTPRVKRKARAHSLAKMRSDRIDVLAVGVSTGGPNALASFIPKLPKDLGVPILLVQHMPATFTKSLASHLNNKSELKVVEAEDGQYIQNNVVYIAPGSKHMVVNGAQLSIIDTKPVNSCKPSVDVLFDSIPKKYKNNVLSVIMTGMGADGLNGVKNLKKLGCYNVTQSADSCVVYGMPRAVDEADLSDENIHLDSLAKRVTDIIKHGPKR